MIRALLRLVEWLDRRYPPRVVLTRAQYDALEDKQHRQSKDLARLAGELLVERERVGSLEKSVAALKEGIVKGQIPLNATERARLRDAFVKGDWGRPGSLEPEKMGAA